MLPGVNPRQMQQMMRRMGINQTEIDATQVIIKTATGVIYIDNPQVSKVNAMGQETFQVSGVIHEEKNTVATFTITDEDVATVVEQTGVGAMKARAAIEASSGDLAQAILSLKGE